MINPTTPGPKKETGAKPRPPTLVSVISGFLLAPLPIGIFITILFSRMGVDSVIGPLNNLSLGVWPLVQLIASSYAIVLGLPAYLFFRWKGWLGPLQTIFAGAILGLVAGASQVPEGYPQANYIAYIGYGAVTAAFFWVIALWRRPE